MKLKRPAKKRYRDFQKKGIRYLLKHKNVLLADDPGLGKTIQSIGHINNDPTIKKVLVICPATLKINWRREIKAWRVRHLRTWIVRGTSDGTFKRIANKKKFIVIINYDVLRHYKNQLDEIKWDLMIVDECQNIKNPKALRTRVVTGRGKTQKHERWKPLKAIRKVFLSGTPITDHPIDLWPIVKLLDKKDLGHSYVRFIYRYCNPKRTRYGMNYKGASNLFELSDKLYSKFMIRRLKSQVLSELPPKIRQVIELPTHSSIREIIERERKIYADYEQFIKMGGSKNVKDRNFNKLSTIRKEIALSKVDQVVDHLKTALANGPVVCFAHHKAVIKRISEQFKCVVITGKTSTRKRQKNIDAFQSGKVNLFIGNIKAAGTGITLTKSQHVVFAELDWTPANLNQAEDRVHRIGQSGSVLIQHLVLENSLDATMIRKLIKKQKVIYKILGKHKNV